MNLLESWSLSSDAQAFALVLAISGVGVGGLALLANRWLRRRSAPLRYGVLFGGVLGLLALPALVGVGFALDDVFASVSEEVMRVPAEHLPEFLAQPAPEPGAIAASSAWGVADVLILGWAFGLAGGVLGLLRSLGAQRRVDAGDAWRPEWWSEERRHLLAKKVGLRDFPRVCQSADAPMPMVVGLLRPTIVVPAESAWSPSQWEAVLLHEAAHIARRDPWAVLAQRIAVLMFWWCPLVHLLSRRLNDLREIICDDFALEGPCDRLVYAELLVETAERLVHWRTSLAPLGLLDSARGGLEERIVRLLEKEKKPMLKISLAGKLIGALALTAGCLALVAATAFSQAPAPQKKIQIKIVIDGKEINFDEKGIAAVLDALKGANPTPTPVAVRFKAAIAPDAKVIVTEDGDKITVIDAATGQIIAKLQHHAGDVKAAVQLGGFKGMGDGTVHKEQVRGYAVGVQAAPPTPAAQPKTDPRIEELIRQAEAIKPGSGAAVRQVFEGKPGVQLWRSGDVFSVPAKPATTPPAAQSGQGRGVIELRTEDGKVLRIVTDHLQIDSKHADPTAAHKKAVEDIMNATKIYAETYAKVQQARANLAAAEAMLRALEKQPPPTAGAAPKANALTNPYGAKPAGLGAFAPGAPVPPNAPLPVAGAPAALPQGIPGGGMRPGMAPVPPQPQGPDLQALARQIERLSAELQDLRKRLDTDKAK